METNEIIKWIEKNGWSILSWRIGEGEIFEGESLFIETEELWFEVPLPISEEELEEIVVEQWEEYISLPTTSRIL